MRKGKVEVPKYADSVWSHGSVSADTTTIRSIGSCGITSVTGHVDTIKNWFPNHSQIKGR